MAIKDKIRELAERCLHELKERMSARVNEMESDDKLHYLA